jgi:putative ABC transport system permease protein
MIKLFFKTTIRYILKNKLYSFLNIFGLTLGLAAFIYIAAYVSYETNFDQFHANANRIYRCVTFAKMGETLECIPRSEYPLSDALKSEIPEVQAATRLFAEDNIYTRYKDNKFIEKKIYFADPNWFDVFDFKLVEGDKATALLNPNSILLTKKAVQKYFGSENPIGKSITLLNNQNFQVTGVLENVPGNSHLQFDLMASSLTLPERNRVDWGSFNNVYTYVLAKEGVDTKVFEQKFETCLKKYEEQVITKYITPSVKEFEKNGNYFKHKLQPLSDIHLNSSFAEEATTYGNLRFLIILGITGILILVIACSNFINLSTATASKRGKEIGVKKIIGSMKKDIFFQVMSEIFVYCIIALILAIVLLAVALPVLNKYSGIIMTFDFFFNKTGLLLIIFMPIVVTLLAGIYPSIFINRFKLIETVKGKLSPNNQKPWMRGSLVAVQFVIFIVLIFSTITINKQINLMRSQNPGFNKENVLVMKNMFYLGDQMASFKNELLNSPSVISASFSSAIPSMDDFAGNAFQQKGQKEKYLMDRMQVDTDFLKTLDAKMLDGHFFSKNLKSESNMAIVNEQAAKLLGWSDSNDKILTDLNGGEKDFQVIGIVKDFHLKSLRENARPLVLRVSDQSNYLAIRIQPGDIPKILDRVKSQWGKFNNDAPFEYFFLDQSFDAQYKSEDRLSKIIGLFTLVAITIACLGLFGLVSYTATQKTKEIGIRKVNGARISEVLIMLNKDFAKWVAMAFFIAMPIAWYAMHKWLEGFAFKTELSWWIFALAGLLALGIALLTVSWQSWRAATRNPVESLRYE